jgi:hypothetical protein
MRTAVIAANGRFGATKCAGLARRWLEGRYNRAL